ncbi:MAG: Bro-N domain-containing protein [Candidatus Cloacimonetes bacterium]|nr:Bro-N domain-containing protein [Candidatus Cloacimonadota bacterium]
METKIAVFKTKEIRKRIFNNEWWFVVEDVVFALTDSVNVKDYIKKMRRRDEELTKGWGQFVTTLEIDTKGGVQKVNCANTEGIFRIIQSIPSSKAEPFKRWLARVGYERVQEIEDPELATKRTKALYKAKGYSENWIEKRMRGIAIREELTDEWEKRKIKEQREYAILTSEISKAAFGLTPSEYKNLKGLKRENLRDHMNDLELIFSMLGEAATTEITRNRNAKGFPKLKKAAKDGGDVAGKARKDLERKSGKKVSTKENYLLKSRKQKKLDKNEGKINI